MFLIADTNILFSLAGKGKVLKLLKQLWNKGVRVITPEFSKEELLKVKKDLIKFTGFSEVEFKKFIEKLEKVVEIVPKSKYLEFLEEAKKISPHKKDIPFFALSLAFKKAPIWSRDAKLKRQKFIKVLSDKEVEDLLKSE